MGHEARVSRRNVLRLSGVAVEKVDEVTARVNALLAGGREVEMRVRAVEMMGAGLTLDLRDVAVRVEEARSLVCSVADRLPPVGWWARLRWLVRG